MKEETAICKACNIEFIYFRYNTPRKYCDTCKMQIRQEKSKKWREEHPEETRESVRKSYKKHIEERRKYGSQYRKDHSEEIKEKNRIRMKEWRKRDPETVQAIDRKYHSTNAAEINKKEKVKRKERPEIYRRYDRKQYEKMRADVGRRLSKNISNSLWYCLAGQKKRKAGLKILSLTKDEITDHFSRLFEEKMSWSNYGKGEGKWSEDHIVPITFFRFTSPEDWEFKKCWNLSNLRPMWDIENSRKRGSLALEIQQPLIKEVLERRRELCAVLPS